MSCVAAFERLISCPDKMCSWTHVLVIQSTHDLPARLCGILARPLAPEWHANNFLQHACRFVDATGRLPDMNESFGGSKVGRWLGCRRSGATRLRLSGEQMQLIEDALGADALVPVFDINFERRLADVAEFQRLHGKLPTKGASLHLAMWLANCRTHSNDGCLSEVQTKRLDTVLGADWRPKFKNTKVCLPRHHSSWQPAPKHTPCWHCLRMC